MFVFENANLKDIDVNEQLTTLVFENFMEINYKGGPFFGIWPISPDTNCQRLGPWFCQQSSEHNSLIAVWFDEVIGMPTSTFIS